MHCKIRFNREILWKMLSVEYVKFYKVLELINRPTDHPTNGHVGSF